VVSHVVDVLRLAYAFTALFNVDFIGYIFGAFCYRFKRGG